MGASGRRSTYMTTVRVRCDGSGIVNVSPSIAPVSSLRISTAIPCVRSKIGALPYVGRMNILLIEESAGGRVVENMAEKLSRPGRRHIVALSRVPSLGEKVRTRTVEDTPEGRQTIVAIFRLCSHPTHIDQSRSTSEEANAEQGAIAIAHVFRLTE